MSTVAPLHNMKKIADLVLGLFLVCSAVLPVIGLLSYADYHTDLKMEETISVEDYEDSYDILCNIGAKRGMKARGGDTDTLRAAIMLVDEFRGGKIGRISLERPC